MRPDILKAGRAGMPVEVSDPKDFLRYQEAVQQHPSDTTLLISFCLSCERHFIDGVADTLESRIVNKDPGAVDLEERRLLVYVKERQHRFRLGLSRSNARGFADIPFQFAEKEIVDLQAFVTDYLQRNPSSYPMAVVLADTLVARSMIAEAESIFAQLRKLAVSDTVGVTSFDPVFHATLAQSANDAVEELPPVVWLRTFEKEPRQFVYVAADHEYFQRYGWPLIGSFLSHPHEVSLVLHVIDMTDEEARALAARLAAMPRPWALSTEWTGLRAPEKSPAARAYYHSVRFVRYWQTLARHPQAAAWLVDVDTLFNGSPAALSGLLDGADASLLMLPARLDTRNKVAAHTVGIAATAAGRAFVQRIAGYVAAWRRRGRLPWGLDQVAIYAVLTMIMSEGDLNVTAIPPQICDGGYDDDRVLWGTQCSATAPEYSRVTERTAAWAQAI